MSVSDVSPFDHLLASDTVREDKEKKEERDRKREREKERKRDRESFAKEYCPQHSYTSSLNKKTLG